MHTQQTTKLLFFLLCLPVFAFGQLVSSNLPIVVIDTEGGEPIPDEPKITAHMGIIHNADNNNSVSDPYNHYDGFIGIEIRGSSSQGFEKKNYAVETRKADGSNNNVSLFGFPKENDWVLHGPYSDKSLMRNAIAYTLAGWIMDYAPRIQFCELVINGQYEGVYLFTEKIKRDKNRVNVAELLPEENQGDELTGGYILKFDKWDGASNDGFPSNYPADLDGFGTTYFLYHYPKPDEITGEQKAYVQQWIHNLEATLMSAGFDSPQYGYRQLLDVPSFISYLFVQEIGKNVDAYRLSTFFYKDKDSKNGKLFMGPVWDFNLAFGNADYCEGWQTWGWAWQFNEVCPADFWIVHFWWERLWQDESFLRQTGQRWQDLRQDTLSNERIFSMVDSLYGVLAGPANRNFQRFNILGNYVWPNAYIGQSYQDEYRYLRNWLAARLNWLDTQMELLAEPKYVDADYFSPRVYPNPFSQQLTFEYYARKETAVALQLYDARGTLVLQHLDKPHPNGENAVQLPAKLPDGLYFYRILFDGKREASGKVVAHRAGN